MRSFYQLSFSRWSAGFAILLGMSICGASYGASGLPSFADLVEKNAATIVEISAIRMVEDRSVLSPRDLEDFLRRRLNPGDGPDLESEPDLELELDPPQLSPRGAVGSGFIISPDGYVITNHHVVQGAEEITVELTDRRELRAKVIGLDEPSDLALLKINAQDLPYVEMGDSDKLRVGDWVLAIGSPFGLEFSAAAGIVSAKGRSVPGNSQSNYNYMSFIQSDVAINQGNSGGPLFNLDGEVVGINSQILSSTGGSNGISFSIPSNVALNVIAQLKATGSVQRGLLGVQIKSVSYALAKSFDLETPYGAFVDMVAPGGPADQAGVQIDDIILEFNGRRIEDSADLPFYVGQDLPGSKANVVVFRNQQRLALNVTLGSSPLNVVLETIPAPVAEKNNPLGLRITALSREARVGSNLSGVQVLEVNEGPALEAGIQPGDIIVSLNRQKIDDVDQFANIIRQLPAGGFVPIRIIHQGNATTLALEIK